MLSLSLSFVSSAYAKKDYASLFSAWKAEHHKEYGSAFAEAKAFKAFAHNEEKITAHNVIANISYELGHNEFSDLFADEFFATKLGYNASMVRVPGEIHVGGPLADAPDAVDWVAKGAVTSVKNQGQCGSCWSFSTTGAIEGAYQIASGKLVSLSEEDLVQCDTVDNGCQGGLMDNAFKYVEKNGLATEASYKYMSGTGIRGMCNKKLQAEPVVTITGYKDVPADDEDALLTAAAIGPVSVAIEADKSAFQLYKKGVLDSKGCGTKLDHGVLLVGYGNFKTWYGATKPYWKVKNSWGPTWGENGYIRMVRGKNQCGIASQASYPTGAKADSAIVESH